MDDQVVPDDVFAGRERELTRIREVAGKRGLVGRSLVVSAGKGFGKTATIREALRGFDGEVAWFTGGQLAAPTSGAHPEYGLVPIPALGQVETVSPAAPCSRGPVETAAEVGQHLIAALTALPARESPAVVVVDDADRCDEFSADLLACLIRRNHLFDVSYILSCLDPPPLIFDDVEQLPLPRLRAEQAQGCLSSWRTCDVSVDIGAAVADLSDGNPLVLRELADLLTEGQLSGDEALPLSLPITPVIEETLFSATAGLTEAELTGLACFADQPSVPARVLAQTCGEEAVASLIAKNLIVDGLGSRHIRSRVLAALALRRLGYPRRCELYRQLSLSWAPVNSARAAHYGCLSGDQEPMILQNARAALTDPRGRADQAVWEHLATTVIDLAGHETTVRDQLTVVAACEQARHLDGAIRALDQAAALAGPTVEDLRLLTRWRGVLSQITHDWSLAIPTARDLSAVEDLRPGSAFEILTRTARNTLLIGSTERARGYLDQARQMGRAASSDDRALWRLVDCQWKIASGESVRAATLLEVVTRWCDQSGRNNWYDDVLAMRALIAAEAFDEARQFMVGVESSYRDEGGYSAIFVPMVRLKYEVATFQVPEALATLATFRSVSRGSRVHLKELGADLIHLETMAGLPPGELGYENARHCVADRVALAEARGQQHLVGQDYLNAAGLFELVLRESPALTVNRRWQVLADLVEAHIALGNVAAAEAAARNHRPPGLPDTPQGVAAQARQHALLAAPMDVRAEFKAALDAADRPLRQVHYGRAQLAYARRLAQLGSVLEAEEQRTAASTAFRHLGLLGWATHADEITIEPTPGNARFALMHERLDAGEINIVKLLLAGMKNSEVAADLHFSLRTVEKALTRIYRKLNVANKAEMLTVIRDQDPTTTVGDPTSTEAS